MADRDRGRWIVGAIALGIVLIGISITAFTAALGAGATWRPAARVLFTALLGWFMYRGHSWARWVNAAASAIGGLIAFFTAVSLGSRGAASGALFLGVFGVLYLAIAAVLAFTPSVAEYFREPPAENFFGSGRES